MKPSAAVDPSLKPVFLSKKEREQLALQRLDSKRQEEELKLKEIERAHENFITGWLLI
jgi:hypothetical protein